MKALGNKVYIKKGEEFTLKFGAYNIEPFVLSKSYKYPFILVRLKSTTYKQHEQYVSTRWLNCKQIQRFENTSITHLGIELPDVGNFHEEPYSQVYSVTSGDDIQYYYFNGTDFVEYNFSFKVNYDSDESNEFTDRQYNGEVYLVDGTSVADYLHDLIVKYRLTLEHDTMYNAYYALRNIHAKEVEDLNVNVPLRVLDNKILLGKFILYSEV